MELTFVTGNKHKYKEAKLILEIPIKRKALDLKEIQALKVDEVVEDKAKEAFSSIKKPVFVEDVALYIEELNSFPGALISWVEDTLGNEGILKLLKGKGNRKAKVVSSIGYHTGEDVRVFRGEIEGRISHKRKKGGGFGFDFIFIPKGYKRTFSELGTKVKNKISHRSRVLKNFKNYLENKDEG